MANQTIADLISQAATRYGLQPDRMNRIAQLESSMNPRAQNPQSSAGGLFQFLDSTWGQYGKGDKYDPVANADAAGRYLTDVSASLSSALGRAPEGWELYLGHQQGPGGARKLLSNPDALASSLVGSAAIRLNGGDPQSMTSAQFADIWKNKYAGTSAMSGPAYSESPDIADVPAGSLADLFGGAIPATPGGFAGAGLLDFHKRREQREEEEEEEAERQRLAALYAVV